MHSIRTKITGMTVCAIIVTMIIATAFGIIAIRNIGNNSANQTLLLLCESGEKNLDSYFTRVEQSVEMVSAYVQSDLDGLSDEKLQAHIDRVNDIFKKMTYETNGILTYYYRIDPKVSTKAKGFWYVNSDDEGFQEHEVTDITQYDTDDTSQLVWFTVPKATGEAVWLPPYITDNLGARVLSYNTPVYLKGKFVGVIGIEIDYSVVKEQVDNITLYENGYAFINDEEGNIVYHPRMDVATMETPPKIQEGLISDEPIVEYTYQGVKKKAACLPLENGMRLNVSVPVAEINAGWERWGIEMVIIFTLLLIAFIILIMRYTRHITKPLQELTQMAKKIDEGDYSVQMDYQGDDEVGILAGTFNQMTKHLKEYIGGLNDLAYADALTSLHNKGAFDICVQDMQKELNEKEDVLDFAVCVFDCNDLKEVNDENGHDKGDIYLKETAEIICEVFEHSPVFRIGGDEFAAVLMNKDYKNREKLLQLFDEKCADKQITEPDAWEQIDVARGMAVYNPAEDESVSDVVRRADRLMYENKWQTKISRSEQGKVSARKPDPNDPTGESAR